MLTGIASVALTLASQITDGIISWAKLDTSAQNRIVALGLLGGD